MTNLASIVTETAERIPDGIAYKLDDTEVNWQAVDEGSARVAGLLKEKGLEPGDRVGVMLPNVPYFPIAYYGILRAGGTVVPMNVLLKGREVKFYLEDSGAKLVFAWHDFAEAAEKGAEEAGAEVDPRQAGRVREAARRRRAGARGRRPRRRRHRGDPLHVGHHRPAQGRRADPRQHAHEREGVARRCSRPTTTTSCSARCRCSIPSARRAA